MHSAELLPESRTYGTGVERLDSWNDRGEQCTPSWKRTVELWRELGQRTLFAAILQDARMSQRCNRGCSGRVMDKDPACLLPEMPVLEVIVNQDVAGIHVEPLLPGSGIVYRSPISASLRCEACQN